MSNLIQINNDAMSFRTLLVQHIEMGNNAQFKPYTSYLLTGSNINENVS